MGGKRLARRSRARRGWLHRFLAAGAGATDDEIPARRACRFARKPRWLAPEDHAQRAQSSPREFPQRDRAAAWTEPRANGAGVGPQKTYDYQCTHRRKPLVTDRS